MKQFNFNGLKTGQMPVGAWVSPTPAMGNKKCHVNDACYRLAAELGLNFLHGIYEIFNLQYTEEAYRSLKLAGKYGLKLLVSDRTMYVKTDSTERFVESYNTYKHEEALAGVLASDEPSSSYFAKLYGMKKFFETVCPEKVFYVNLLPMYARPEQLCGEKGREDYTYENYIDDYIDIFKPEFLSYDYYPLYGKFPHFAETYFDQLAIIRAKTLKADIPFWNFVLTTSFHSNVRIPVKSEIFYQATTALAFGSKGIQYFTFDTPVNSAVPEGEFFQAALIDYDGRPTERYYFVQELNAHLKSVEKVLMGSVSQGLIAVGTSPAVIPESCLIPRFRSLKSVEGRHALVGCFDYNGKTALYVVNNTIENADDITLTFDTVQRLGVSVKTNHKILQADTLTLSLEAGEGALITIL